jgi:hypothetical protein
MPKSRYWPPPVRRYAAPAATMVPVPPTTTPVYSTRFKILAAVLLAAAIAAFVGAYLTFAESDSDPVLRSGGQDEYVEALMPARNSQVPAQSRVGIDLVNGWTGVLVVNGVEIPEDELDVTQELGLVEFTAADGRAVEQLEGGQNCVTAVVWPLSEGREQGSRNVTWCFEAV